MVELTIDTSNLINGEVFDREDFIDPAAEYLVHLENLLNGIQAAEAILAGLGLLDAKSALQLNSSTKVFLPPRQTTAEREAIEDVPVAGFVYDTDEDAPTVFDGSAWHSMAAIATSSKKASAYVYYSSGSNYFISNNVPTLIKWNTERYDTDNMNLSESEDTKLTANTAGKYFLSTTISVGGSDGGNTLVELLLNGTTVIASSRIQNIGVFVPTNKVATLYELAEGDYVQVRVTQKIGASRSLNQASSHFSAHLQLAENATSLFDTFSTPAAGPLSSPRPADIGTWVFTQNDGQFSIV